MNATMTKNDAVAKAEAKYAAAVAKRDAANQAVIDAEPAMLAVRLTGWRRKPPPIWRRPS
jgi:hypothetical protein